MNLGLNHARIGWLSGSFAGFFGTTCAFSVLKFLSIGLDRLGGRT
jgi:hypothetical protein